jgi:RNA polymerase sigma factor, sigma-70 family
MAKTTQLIFEILDAEKEKLFQYASYRLLNIKDVEDVLQNMYVKILDNPQRFLNVGNKRSYLYRTVSNECTDLIRANARIKPLSDEAFATLDRESLQPDNFEEEFMMINRLLTILPMEQSEVIRLRHHSNLSFQEIADIMEVPLPTAKARYRYGIEKIRKSLKSLKLL